jgi:hypothetical protein
MNTESPLLEILLTRNQAKALLAAKPAGEEERHRLMNKIAACDVALNFLRANSESASQMLMRIPGAISAHQSSASRNA